MIVCCVKLSPESGYEVCIEKRPGEHIHFGWWTQAFTEKWVKNCNFTLFTVTAEDMLITAMFWLLIATSISFQF